MSLSTILLGASGKKSSKKAPQIDQGLDDLFHSNAFTSVNPVTEEPVSATPGPSKKKRKVREDDREEPEPTKKVAVVHETLAEKKEKRDRGTRSAGKAKYTPQEETPEQRDARTIFVGNLSVEVAQKQPLLKQLQRHILTQVHSAKIESTRFRSVPFQNPTSKMADDADPKSTKEKHNSTKAAREHDIERASTWRQTREDEEGKKEDKKFLSPKEKKRIAFINHEFHSSADTVNAYIVFSHPQPTETRPSNLPPPPPTLDPYEAARLAVEKCDGTMFMDRMIRVDHVSKDVKQNLKTENVTSLDGDPKLTVFVGNLDFASKEEDLRIFFEGVVSTERGPPPIDEAQRSKSWVTRVRIVRDRDTQLGKGFAYVQFLDRECVDEILALEETKLKFAKRKLRVQRCKTLPGQTITQKKPSTPKKSADTIPRSQTVPVVPKGDPSLGQKLMNLPKEERKQLKASNADRVARRLAKKKARNVLAKEGLKPKTKDRDRVRKSLGPKQIVTRKKESGGRLRSERSLSKRNIKK